MEWMTGSCLRIHIVLSQNAIKSPVLTVVKGEGNREAILSISRCLHSVLNSFSTLDLHNIDT